MQTLQEEQARRPAQRPMLRLQSTHKERYSKEEIASMRAALYAAKEAHATMNARAVQDERAGLDERAELNERAEMDALAARHDEQDERAERGA